MQMDRKESALATQTIGFTWDKGTKKREGREIKMEDKPEK